MSRRCLEPRWFVGYPTSLARDNIIDYRKCIPRARPTFLVYEVAVDLWSNWVLPLTIHFHTSDARVVSSELFKQASDVWEWIVYHSIVGP